MLRGMTLFKCTECGKRFIASDVEYMATAMSNPQPCPKCKSHRTRPSRLVGGFDSQYKVIWDKMEKEQ